MPHPSAMHPTQQDSNSPHSDPPWAGGVGCVELGALRVHALSLGICLEEREREKHRKTDTQEPPPPWPALCSRPPAQALSRGAHWGLALGPSRIQASSMACPPHLSLIPFLGDPGSPATPVCALHPQPTEL